MPPPTEWADLADARYAGQIALADPTKSSSIAKAFENVIQQQIQRRMTALPGAAGKEAEAAAVRDGWRDGLRLIQQISANARYFTDSSQKPVIDVAQGDCAAGVCIDFYGQAQAEAVNHRGAGRLAFVAPRGGTVNSVDPIALFRGAPHREAAELFIEFTLSMAGQKLWAFKADAPGGPDRFALRRLPVRRDFYAQTEWKPLRSDPEAAPFSDPNPLVYHPAWTAHLFRELAFGVRVMGLDSHAELTAAWRAIREAPEPVRARALAKLGELDAVDYAQANGAIRQTLNAKNKVEEVRLATELGGRFRRQYRAAEAIARGRE
ncbi:MAG: ABC transporter substrate-binding protein [Verrucomicrobia bacterium]|nr:ABC transporter substrate-binding protein [Verrucomicrobiota bacterium]